MEALLPYVVAGSLALILLVLAWMVRWWADPSLVKRVRTPAASEHTELELAQTQAERDLLMRLLQQYAPAPLVAAVEKQQHQPPPAPTVTERQRLIAIFPDGTGLDYSREREILRTSGGPWETIFIENTRAVRREIVREIKLGGCRLLYLASHGQEGRILLTGGEHASSGWLARLIRQFKIEAMVLNACDSDTLVEACLAAGCKLVVTAAEKIADAEAARFAVAFIQALALGTSAQEALDLALLSVEDETRDLVRLRGDPNWKWG
jgi:hypothetical protein